MFNYLDIKYIKNMFLIGVINIINKINICILLYFNL